MRTCFFLLAAFLLASFHSYAQVPPAYAARLQQVLDSTCSRYHVKGASAAVYIPGSGLWEGAYGESYSGQPITSPMAFPLNSNTKTYTAALMLKLQEEGLLQLSDTIGTWIRGKANINGRITLRQLLNHTSGLYSYTDSPAYADSVYADFARIWRPADMLQFVGPPRFAPGSSWSYSNTNYLLAGMIIAQVAGMPVETVLRNRLLDPQNLSHTWFYPQELPTAVIPHFWFLDGLQLVDGATFGYTPEGSYSTASTAGALFSTAADNASFWHKLLSGQIVTPASLSQWRQTVPLSATMGYGLGMTRYRSINGHVVYAHSGGGPGTLNENLADSVSDVCISLLTNQDSADNDLLFSQVVCTLHKVTLHPPTAIADVRNSTQFTLYPNPAKGALHLSLTQAAGKSGAYTITDATGRTVRTGTLSRQDLTTIELGNLQNGLYYLRVSEAGRTPGVSSFTILK